MPKIVPIIEITASFQPVNDGQELRSETVRLELKEDGRVAFPTGACFDARELREGLDLMLKGRSGQPQPFNPHQGASSPLLQPGQSYRGGNVAVGSQTGVMNNMRPDPTLADESS